MANIKIEYAASTAPVVTGLQSLASSPTYVAGWESEAIDNGTTNKYLDYLVSAKIVVGNAVTASTQIRVYVVGILDDTNWPDVFDGTEGAPETITDVEIRDGFAKLAAVVDVDADAGTDDTYYIGPFAVASLFGGVCPAKFVIFITHSTGVNLASSGNAVWVKGVYATV